jgi:hypothetical protein
VSAFGRKTGGGPTITTWIDPAGASVAVTVVDASIDGPADAIAAEGAVDDGTTVGAEVGATLDGDVVDAGLAVHATRIRITTITATADLRIARSIRGALAAS